MVGSLVAADSTDYCNYLLFLPFVSLALLLPILVLFPIALIFEFHQLANSFPAFSVC